MEKIPPFNITYHNLVIVDRYQPKVCGCFEKDYWSRLKINMSLSSTFKEPHDEEFELYFRQISDRLRPRPRRLPSRTPSSRTSLRRTRGISQSKPSDCALQRHRQCRPTRSRALLPLLWRGICRDLSGNQEEEEQSANAHLGINHRFMRFTMTSESKYHHDIG